MTGHNIFKKWNLFPEIACFMDKNMNACETENHSKSYIYFESRILIKMYHDNHTKIE